MLDQILARLLDGCNADYAWSDIHAAHSVSVVTFKMREETYKIINSTALPKDTLSKAPQVSPSREATTSVA